MFSIEGVFFLRPKHGIDFMVGCSVGYWRFGHVFGPRGAHGTDSTFLLTENVAFVLSSIQTSTRSYVMNILREPPIYTAYNDWITELLFVGGESFEPSDRVQAGKNYVQVSEPLIYLTFSTTNVSLAWNWINSILKLHLFECKMYYVWGSGRNQIFPRNTHVRLLFFAISSR